MKGDPKVIAGLDECLKYERTSAACYEQHREYFKRWHYDRLRIDFVGLGRRACKRKSRLMQRLNELDTIPQTELYEVEVSPIDKAADIRKPMEYFIKMLGEARDAYRDARTAAANDDDSATAKLLGRNKKGIEKDLVRFEAKLKRINTVGPEIYLGHHMHPED